MELEKTSLLWVTSRLHSVLSAEQRKGQLALSVRGKNFKIPRAQLQLLFAKRGLKSVSQSPDIFSVMINIKNRVAKAAVLSL